jgi:hypothetical protein
VPLEILAKARIPIDTYYKIAYSSLYGPQNSPRIRHVIFWIACPLLYNFLMYAPLTCNGFLINVQTPWNRNLLFTAARIHYKRKVGVKIGRQPPLLAPSRPFSILLPLPCPPLPARAQKTILQPNLSVLQLKDFATPVISQYSFHARIMKRGSPFILHHFWTGVGC